MEHLVDLDVLAARLAVLVADWERHVQVGAFTWRDERAEWPAPIVNDRAQVELPESLGIRLSRESEDEAEIVVWTGGWADVAQVVDAEVAVRCPEFRDVDGAYEAVTQAVEDFLT